MTADWWTFSRMRGDREPRTWIRWSELWATVQAEIPALGAWDVRRALRAAPPAEKKYGHKHYTTEHLAAVRAYADRLGLNRKGTS
jgi:hypothetical protein